MWTFQNDAINSHEDLHPDCTDIVYWITFENGKHYIGKKTVRSLRKYPPLKGKKRARRKVKNIPFANYKGSSEETKDLEPISKEILYQCSTKKAATYLEAALLFHHNAIFESDFLNQNISGRFFDNDLDGMLND